MMTTTKQAETNAADVAGKDETIAAKPKRRTRAQIDADAAAGIVPVKAKRAPAK